MMTVYDFSEPDLVLPSQLVVDTSFLLALRQHDDNPHAVLARAFMQRMRQYVATYTMVAWVPLPVLQECYHIILTQNLRRIWQTLDATTRPPNWLKLYKDQPQLVAQCTPELVRFRQHLLAFPFTFVQASDFVDAESNLASRMLHCISVYHLLPQDALILAHAEALGVRAVVTLDRDWQRAAPFDVYTCL